MYFESHAHYNDERYKDDRDQLLGHILNDSGIEKIINIGADMKSTKESVELANKYDYIYASVGVHPHSAEEVEKTDYLSIVEAYATDNPKVVAIGEIGLDFFYDNSPRDVQETVFKQQLYLAKKLNLPVIIHARDADQLVFDIIKQADLPKENAGVIHCYSGSAEMALEYVKLGFLIGVGGVATYKNARKLQEAVVAVGLKSILLETDCPYLSPIPNRGERNSSLNLKYIAEKIAELCDTTHDEVAEITYKNAMKLFRIKQK